MKTLDEVEARVIVNESNTPGDDANSFIITEPGSYYLIGNLVGTQDKHGVSIRANDVTLDLNGFALVGIPGTPTSGVDVPVNQSGLCIRDGCIRGWTGGGVQARTSVTFVEKLRVSDSAVGILVGNGSLVKDCLASGNEIGFSLTDRTQIVDCIATVNSSYGFQATSYVTIIDCTASRNYGGAGIVVDNGCTIIRCSSTRSLPSGSGIIVGAGCNVVDCVSANNGRNGYVVGAGSVIRNCLTRANVGVGIHVIGDDCLVTDNTCVDNNQGIVVKTSGSRVEANSCVANKVGGFDIAGVRNIVVRNSSRGSFANTFFGSSQDVLGPSVAMGGGEIPINSPWANFSILDS